MAITASFSEILSNHRCSKWGVFCRRPQRVTGWFASRELFATVSRSGMVAAVGSESSGDCTDSICSPRLHLPSVPVCNSGENLDHNPHICQSGAEVAVVRGPPLSLPGCISISKAAMLMRWWFGQEGLLPFSPSALGQGRDNLTEEPPSSSVAPFLGL